MRDVIDTAYQYQQNTGGNLPAELVSLLESMPAFQEPVKPVPMTRGGTGIVPRLGVDNPYANYGLTPQEWNSLGAMAENEYAPVRF